MATAVLAATAQHDPKNLLKAADDLYGEGGDARHNPQDPSDFENWSWERSTPSE